MGDACSKSMWNTRRHTHRLLEYGCGTHLYMYVPALRLQCYG